MRAELPASTSKEIQAVRAKAEEIGRKYKWISRDAVYTASSVYQNDRPSPKLMTGEGSEYGTHNFHTNMEDAPDIVINLGAVHAVSALEMENRKRDDVLDRAATLTVWTGNSENGPWTQQWRAKVPQLFFAVVLPQPELTGLGSSMAATTRCTPAARMASVHGPVRPVWLHGSSVTYIVAPRAFSPAHFNATISA